MVESIACAQERGQTRNMELMQLLGRADRGGEQPAGHGDALQRAAQGAQAVGIADEALGPNSLDLAATPLRAGDDARRMTLTEYLSGKLPAPAATAEDQETRHGGHATSS